MSDAIAPWARWSWTTTPGRILAERSPRCGAMVSPSSSWSRTAPPARQRGLGLRPLADRCEIVATGANLGFGSRRQPRRGPARAPTSSSSSSPTPTSRSTAVRCARWSAALDEHPGWGIVGPTILTEGGCRLPLGAPLPRPPRCRRATPCSASSARTTRSRVATARRREDRRWRRLGLGLLLRSCVGAPSSSSGASTRATSCSPRTWTCASGPMSGGSASAWRRLAVVTHVEGVTRRAHPYRMLLAHHRSALRFAVRSTRARPRLALPLAGPGARACGSSARWPPPRCGGSLSGLRARGSR